MPKLGRPMWVVGATLALGVAWLGFGGELRAPPRLAEPRDAAMTQQLRTRARVILVTLDGPKREDIFSPALMPKLHAALKQRRGALLEARAASSMALSLPGYQALATGVVTKCLDNECPRVAQDTVAEFLAERLALERDEVAVFASWSRMRRAVAQGDARVLIDAPDDGPPREGGPLWKNARFDAQTFDAALAHLTRTRPRFLQVSFLDMDEWAHAGFREEYEAALGDADARIAHLLDWVESLPPDERALTTVLITSDHGRGHGDWREHGFFHRGSGETFLAAFPVRGVVGRAEVDQRDVRPTIERLFGFCTEARRASGAGRPIGAVVGELPCEE